MVSSLRKSSTRQNKSVESLRSKSWAQCIENTSSPLSGGGTRDMVHSQATLFGQQQQQQQQRRFSYGWPPATQQSNTHIPSSPSIMDGGSYDYFINDKNRLTNSHSYSDLHAAARSYTTASKHPHPPHPHQQQQQQHYLRPRQSQYDLNDTKDMSLPCSQYMQYGMCPLDDQCPYSHQPTTSSATAPLAFNHTIAPSPHPLSTYQPYPPNQTTSSLLGNPSFGGTTNFAYDPNFFPTSKLMPRYGSFSAVSNTSNVIDNFGLFMDNNNNNNVSSSSNSNSNNNKEMMTADVSQRRSIADPEANRFLGAKLEDFHGKLYDLCKDHNGCRFLQKKLEDPNGQYLQTIFDEIHPHFVELMTGK